MQTSRLQVARDPALALTVRIFVGGVTERWGVPEQLRDDLRLAASELFSGAVEAGGEGTVGLTLSSEDAEIVLLAEGVDAATDGRSDGPTWDDRFGLIRALFPEAEVGDSVRIRVPTAQRPP